MASRLEPGQMAGVVAFHHADRVTAASALLPVFRPAFHQRLAAGVAGPLSLQLDGLLGISPWVGAYTDESLTLELLGGPRFAAPDHPHARFALAFLGGIRDVPPRCTASDRGSCAIGRNSYYTPYDVEVYALAITRIEAVWEIRPRRRLPAALIRFRYDAHWIREREVTHTDTTTTVTRAALDSQTWELRGGLLAGPDEPASPFFELGVQLHERTPLTRVFNVGLVFEVGAAWGSGKTGP